MYSEEVELDGRDPEQDFLQYKESCESLATLMSEIQDLKASGAKEGVSTVLPVHTDVSTSVRDTEYNHHGAVQDCPCSNNHMSQQQKFYRCSL